ncbi:MAG: dihydropteroate synthase [Geobacter sp.]|nr:dihydropteroate synthase [Geobacter sp.]
MSLHGSIWRCGDRTLDLGRRPCIMGILNVTPDSFSDGGSFLDLDRAVDHALLLEEEGAGIIDVGGESTRPFAEPLSEDDELRRVIPVVERLAGRLSIPISVDTYKASVARAAIAAGAEIINDISAFTFDPRMAEAVSASRAGVVLMHTRGRPGEMQVNTEYRNLIPEVVAFLDDALARAELAGIDRDRVVVDPGIGFGKDLRGNLEILRRLNEFSVLDRPILIGTSRKGFIGKLLNRDVGERQFGTAATVASAFLQGASIFRVHDVGAMRDVVLMMQAIRDGLPEPAP